MEKSFNFFEENKTFNNDSNEVFIEEVDEKTNINLKIVKTIKNFGISDFCEINESCIAFSNYSTIYIYDKNNFTQIFKIKEFNKKIIKIGKIENNKFFGISYNFIIVFNILNNNDYIIENSLKSPSQIIETNCSDIYYIDLFNINYYYCLKYPYTDSIEEFSSENKYIKLTFLGKDLMVAFNNESLDFYKKIFIQTFFNSKIYFEKKSSIFDINEQFYLINNLDIIYLLNKKNFNLAKTINLDIDHIDLRLFQNNKKIFTIIYNSHLKNYYHSLNYLCLKVLNNGLQLKKEKNQELNTNSKYQYCFLEKFNNFYFCSSENELIIIKEE